MLYSVPISEYQKHYLAKRTVTLQAYTEQKVGVTDNKMIQVVFVKWGDRYSATHVNNTFLEIRKLCSRDVKCVCITDDASGLVEDIVTHPFPDWGDWFEALKKGCRLKLSMFHEGLLDPDLPTLFFDLDTMILGDVAKLVAPLETTGGMYMSRGHFIPFWRFIGLPRIFVRNYFYYGNSPMLAFYPRDFVGLIDDFKKEFSYVRWRGITHKWPLDRICKTDERFISYHARDRVRVFPKHLAIKFTTEYMTPFFDMTQKLGKLPWVKRRRASQVALTFSGHVLKPSLVKDMKQGQKLTSRHYRMTWNYPEFAEYWTRMDSIAQKKL